VNEVPPATTTERTVVRGAPVRTGARATYYSLGPGPGEAHALRCDLGAPEPLDLHEPRGVVSLVHVTDLQLADVQSPGRMEFIDRQAGRPGWAPLIPMHRPQEAMVAHAVDALLRAIRVLPPTSLTGRAPEVVVSTGDAIDNRQENELAWLMALLSGETVRASSGGSAFEGVQAPDWPDPRYWHPDDVADDWKAALGFPTVPGLLELATQPFRAAGLDVAWLGCFGNHEALVHGVAPGTPAYDRALVGDIKALELAEGFDPADPEARFLAEPEAFLSGPSRAVAPDPARAAITRRRFVEAHLAAPGLPVGHGYTPADALAGRAYYAWDGLEGMRFIVLDTSHAAGGSAGSVGRDQLSWLEARLAEVHTVYRDPDGRRVAGGGAERLVLVFSHHGSTTLHNRRPLADEPPPALGDEVVALLQRFPNVVAWVNGHTHHNAVRARPSAEHPDGGFWELTTASVADWPSQARVIEVARVAPGWCRVRATMLDHSGPLRPDLDEGPLGLAALHRELAANAPGRGIGGMSAGRPSDRNVDLFVPVGLGG